MARYFGNLLLPIVGCPARCFTDFSYWRQGRGGERGLLPDALWKTFSNERRERAPEPESEEHASAASAETVGGVFCNGLGHIPDVSLQAVERS